MSRSLSELMEPAIANNPCIEELFGHGKERERLMMKAYENTKYQEKVQKGVFTEQARMLKANELQIQSQPWSDFGKLQFGMNHPGSLNIDLDKALRDPATANEIYNRFDVFQIVRQKDQEQKLLDYKTEKIQGNQQLFKRMIENARLYLLGIGKKPTWVDIWEEKNNKPMSGEDLARIEKLGWEWFKNYFAIPEPEPVPPPPQPQPEPPQPQPEPAPPQPEPPQPEPQPQPNNEFYAGDYTDLTVENARKFFYRYEGAKSRHETLQEFINSVSSSNVSELGIYFLKNARVLLIRGNESIFFYFTLEEVRPSPEETYLRIDGLPRRISVTQPEPQPQPEPSNPEDENVQDSVWVGSFDNFDEEYAKMALERKIKFKKEVHVVQDSNADYQEIYDYIHSGDNIGLFQFLGPYNIPETEPLLIYNAGGIKILELKVEGNYLYAVKDVTKEFSKAIDDPEKVSLEQALQQPDLYQNQRINIGDTSPIILTDTTVGMFVYEGGGYEPGLYKISNTFYVKMDNGYIYKMKKVKGKNEMYLAYDQATVSEIKGASISQKPRLFLNIPVLSLQDLTSEAGTLNEQNLYFPFSLVFNKGHGKIPIKDIADDTSYYMKKLLDTTNGVMIVLPDTQDGIGYVHVKCDKVPSKGYRPTKQLYIEPNPHTEKPDIPTHPFSTNPVKGKKYPMKQK